MTEIASRRRSRWADLALLLACLAALVLRAPNILMAPRLFAEEGRFYFVFAFENGFVDSLFFVFRKAGYLNLATNLATGLASLVPLEYAPWVTTWFAFVVQSIPFLILVYGTGLVFTSFPARAAACAIVAFAPHVSGDQWLTSLQSQVFLGLIALLILMEDMRGAGRGRRWAYRFLLGFGGLSGPYTVFLAPVFAFRAFVERERERVVQLSFVGAALVLQVALFMSMPYVNPARPAELGASVLSNLSYFHIGVPVVGAGLASAIAEGAGPVGDRVFLLVLAAPALLVLFDARRRRLRLEDPRVTLLLALLLLGVVTSAMSFKGHPGGRYAFTSGCALLFLILAGIVRTPSAAITTALSALLGFSLLAGLAHYRDPRRLDLQCDGQVLQWEAEVARWHGEVEAARVWNRPVSGHIPVCPNWVVGLRPREP